MHKDARTVLSGVALGAIAGAIGAVVYSRLLAPQEGADVSPEHAHDELDFGQVARLAIHVIGVVRQIITFA